MQSDNEGNLLEIIDLANTLRQEQLFIQHEQAAFANLSETLTKNSSLIAELAWICAQLRQNLNDLIISRPDTGPSLCCQRANRLENAKFVNAYKAKGLKYQHILSYNELFHYLYHSPYLLAQSLAAGDRISKMSVDQMNSIVHTITTGLYGNVIHSKDVEMILKLLRELIEIQIVVNENPRRMLRIGSSAFARLYNRLTESLFSAKIFLTAALHAPVMKVLTESESTLDIDPNKALTALSSKEKLKRFGPENTTEYNENIQKYRDDTINQLFEFTNEFIENLIKNWSLFPSTLRWLVQTMCHQLKQAHINDKDINEIITDMVFTYFICPALVSPDIYGITDAQISEIARFNLIQIGQIIQMLALIKYEDVEQQKFNDVYKKFNRNVVANLLEQLLVNDSDVDVGGVDVVAIRSQQSDFERAQVLLTQTELSVFIDFLRTVLDYDELIISGDERRKLAKILDHLPDKFEAIVNGGAGGDITLNSSSTSSAQQQNFIITSSTLSSSSSLQQQQQQSQLEQQIQNSSSSGNRTKQSLINLGKTTKNKIAKTMSLNITTHTNFETDDIILTSTTAASANSTGGGTNGTTITNLSNNNNNNNYSHHNGGGGSGVNNFHNSPSRTNHHNQNNINSNSIQNHFSAMYDDIEQVLVFPISIADDNKMKLLTEEEVLKMNSIGQQDIVVNPSLIEENIEKLDKVDTVGFDVLNPVLRPVQTKTTRFSLSHDDASIGNSDNLEAVSEAPSNHSVTSSLELEENDQNDNLSDMVSANVSGRGTPNISGRDTPSSQVTEGENLSNQIPTPQMAKIINKARSDIEDKFCKFEIKKLIEGDETISIISDTWSTDVLASDSEILDSNEKDRNFSTPLIPSAVVLPGDNNFDVLTGSSRSRATGNYLDASETRSESAWSTDVLASDSEKLAEVDTDDNASITAKSDTTDAGRFEGEREQENSASSSVNQNRTPDSPFFAPRSTNQNFRTPDSPMYTPRNTEFFAQSSSYDESLARDRYSSLARSSTRTTNQYTGENSFQQNYKSTVDRCSFLTANNSRMRRQNSAESSISNQSLSLDDCYGMKTKQEANAEFQRKSSKDLIDFSDFQEDGASGGTNKTENVDGNDDMEACYRGFSEESVIHRRISSEQRNASFDGRRNGMMEFKAGDSAKNNQRRHQSLNYENHDIIIDKTTQRVVSVPNPETSLTDDVKTQQNLIDEMLLIQKAEELSLNNNNSNTNSITTNSETVVEVIETQTSSNNIQKPSRSTGAIPKSISFDSSADKSDRNISISRRINDPIRVNGSGFFHKIKQGFKNRRGNKNRLSHDDFTTPSTTTTRNVSFGGNIGLETTASGNGGENGFTDMTEDILAKYRRKVSTSSETTNSDSTGGSCSAANHKNSDIEPRLTNGHLPDKAMAFINAKRKIRTVLSSTDLHTGDFRHTTFPNISPLLTYLQIQLAQAINLQNFQQISYVSEAIRCLNSLDFLQHHKLIKELQDDIIKRQSYLQYLMRYRQNLLSIIENIDQFEERLRNERDQCNRHLLSVCIRMFLEKREKLIEEFHIEFSNLTVVDEKIDFLEEFMIKLMNELKIDGILCGMADWQLEEARISIERNLLQRLYKQIMFPNDDVDMSRDEVLHEHICKLQRIITPSHTALRIPQEYLSEAPWPFAQQQIAYISAYITPREKLLCVVRCIQSIMNLLQMACDRAPATDDLLPVLIYVLIKANPPYLLSTIQYVNCFIGDKLDGQDQFHWTQFCSVVQFIKTLDYLD